MTIAVDLGRKATKQTLLKKKDDPFVKKKYRPVSILNRIISVVDIKILVERNLSRLVERICIFLS